MYPAHPIHIWDTPDLLQSGKNSSGCPKNAREVQRRSGSFGESCLSFKKTSWATLNQEKPLSPCLARYCIQGTQYCLEILIPTVLNGKSSRNQVWRQIVCPQTPPQLLVFAKSLFLQRGTQFLN